MDAVLSVSSNQRKTVGEGVAVVDEDGVEAGLRAQPAIEGMMPSWSPTLAAASTRPLNIEPMIDSWMKSSPTLSLPLADHCAMRAEVPVPQGERSIALSP